MHYIADHREEWRNTDEFFDTGRTDVERFLAGVDWGDTSGASLLEIGCGLGRMTRFFAPHFASITGVDISHEMVRGAKALNAELPNLHFEACSGTDLRKFADASFDFVISYIVFQHLPRPEIVHGYIREGIRVLKPAGRFRFQARNDFAESRMDTYDGASVRVEDVREIAERRGRKLLHVSGEGQQGCFFEIG